MAVLDLISGVAKSYGVTKENVGGKLVDLASNLGGGKSELGSSIAKGASAGAAIGSVVPGIGTAVGTVAGAIGGAIGELGRDYIKINGQEVTKQQLEELTGISTKGKSNFKILMDLAKEAKKSGAFPTTGNSVLPITGVPTSNMLPQDTLLPSSGNTGIISPDLLKKLQEVTIPDAPKEDSITKKWYFWVFVVAMPGALLLYFLFKILTKRR